jgi:hypothetical protein
MVLDGDSPRTRESDPVSSHIAADVSQRRLHETKSHVLQLIAENGRLVGTELNDLYLLAAARRGWRQVAFDSPRKRAGELAADGLLEVDGYGTSDGNHLPEAIYTLSVRGAALINEERTAS